MKKVNIFTAAILFAMISLPASAQMIRPGLEAGGTISSSTWQFENGQKAKSIGGYTIGITLETEILDNIWLQSGLSFLTKGAQVSVTGETVSGNITRDRTETFRPMYVQIPINIAYKFNLSQRIRLFVSGGAFLSYGIGGEYNKKLSYSGQGSAGWENENVNQNVFSSKALTRFDCGLNAGVGVEFGNLILRTGYDWSMLDIVKDKTVLGADQFKNRSLAIVLGLKFK